MSRKPRPYATGKTWELYCGNASKILPRLPRDSVDAVITDPPYSSGGMVRSDRTQDVHTKYVNSEQLRDRSGSGALSAFAGDNRDQIAYLKWCVLWLDDCLRVVKPGGIIGMFSDWRQLTATTDAMQAGGFVWRGVVPWCKPDARPRQGFTQSCEFFPWGTKGAGPAPGFGVLPGFFLARSPRGDDRQHVTQKPLEVMRETVRAAPVGGVVLDPFAGAGTTGVAALIEGRRFIGCEITEEYAAITAENLRTAEQGYRDDGVQLAIPMHEPDPAEVIA